MQNSSFAIARKTMVDCQLRPSKVTDPFILDAFMTTPREDFVGKQQRALAYVDEDLPLSGGRCLMEPMVLARLLQALKIRPDDNLLIVGGSGFLWNGDGVCMRRGKPMRRGMIPSRTKCTGGGGGVASIFLIFATGPLSMRLP